MAGAAQWRKLNRAEVFMIILENEYRVPRIKGREECRQPARFIVGRSRRKSLYDETARHACLLAASRTPELAALVAYLSRYLPWHFLNGRPSIIKSTVRNTKPLCRLEGALCPLVPQLSGSISVTWAALCC